MDLLNAVWSAYIDYIPHMFSTLQTFKGTPTHCLYKMHPTEQSWILGWLWGLSILCYTFLSACRVCTMVTYSWLVWVKSLWKYTRSCLVFFPFYIYTVRWVFMCMYARIINIGSLLLRCTHNCTIFLGLKKCYITSPEWPIFHNNIWLYDYGKHNTFYDQFFL